MRSGVRGDADLLTRASRPRASNEFHDFYERWKSQIFAFFLLMGGDRARAELLTRQTFVFYFRCADRATLRTCSEVPVALLRFAADLAGIHCSQRLGAGSGGRTRDLLALPFQERAAFVLVSMLRLPCSTAAVALALRRSQLTEHWICAALSLRRFWLGGDIRTAQGVFAAPFSAT